jgi:hypothetical protein
VLMVTILRGRHEWWAHRLAGVVGRRVGSPNEMRRQIEQRLYAFGARKRDRKYFRIDRGAAKAGELSPELTNYVERVLDSILAESGTKGEGPGAIQESGVAKQGAATRASRIGGPGARGGGLSGEPPKTKPNESS